MERMKFSEILDKTVADGTKAFAPIADLCMESYNDFKLLCKDFDDLVEDVDAESLETRISSIDGEIHVSIECEVLSIDEHHHSFYNLIKEADSFSFHHNEVPRLVITFKFPGVWDFK